MFETPLASRQLDYMRTTVARAVCRLYHWSTRRGAWRLATVASDYSTLDLQKLGLEQLLVGPACGDQPGV